MTQNWCSIGTIDDIPRRGARCVKHGEMTIAIFRTADDQIFALEDKCPHKNGPLSQGIVHDGCVTCPLHNWVISLESGQAQGADEGKTMVFPIKLDEKTILIDLSKSSGTS
ncbi:MAG: nitrite reductase small subunit NirD [Rhizobiaceae bacterium]|nr:nitrite reductase small subunit NirD [Rhizobiaceae bacterium]MBL4731902.1 nitrite reductase small subunit NirD [Rhizobiaceae bacterium]